MSDPGDSGSHGAASGVHFSGNGSQMDPVSDRGQSFDGSSFGRVGAGDQLVDRSLAMVVVW